jgi:hypothetical protein
VHGSTSKQASSFGKKTCHLQWHGECVPNGMLLGALIQATNPATG